MTGILLKKFFEQKIFKKVRMSLEVGYFVSNKGPRVFTIISGGRGANPQLDSCPLLISSVTP